jgi:hypothetical protein
VRRKILTSVGTNGFEFGGGGLEFRGDVFDFGGAYIELSVNLPWSRQIASDIREILFAISAALLALSQIAD